MRRYAFPIALCSIVLLGAGLRLYHLSTVPTELIADEVDLYNSAQSIAATGHDIDGRLEPFFYSKFTRNPPIYGIAAYASSLVFGKSPFGLRFPAVLFGLASILLVCGITLELTRRRDAALVAALVTAIGPIFVQFSRIAWEPSSELPFLLAGLYVLVRTFNRACEPGATRPVSLPGLAFGALLLALVSYTYMAGWFYALVLGASLAALGGLRLRSREAWMKIAAASAIWLAVSLPALWTCFFDPLTVSKTARIATFASGVSLRTIGIFAYDYVAHFRWTYLVTTGDPQPAITWRYLNGFGALFWWVVVLAVVGVGYVSAYVRERWAAVWIYVWIVAYPLGGSLTNEGAPNAPRTLAGMPAFCILAAVGAAALYDAAAALPWPRAALAAKRAAFAVLAIAAAASVTTFSMFYFTHYVHRNSNAWVSGTRAMYAAVSERAGEFDRVCISIRPGSYDVDSFNRFYLHGLPIQPIDDVDEPACFLPGTLLVTDNGALAQRPGFFPIATILDVDGNQFAQISGRLR